MTTRITIEDHVVPQLLTSAIEAYEIEHRFHRNGRAQIAVETYGLLWGYVLPARNDRDLCIICNMATVETSAIRHEEWVMPNPESLIMKRDFFQSYWPNIELVGTFHSHPYSGQRDVIGIRGWRASDTDKNHWPWFHENLSPELPAMAHLIVTIAALERRGWARPQRLPLGEADTGFVLSSGYRKLWIKAYASEKIDEETYECSENTFLDIPALLQRFG
jgi:hypothetical protein